MEGPGISTQLLGHLFFYIHTHSLGLDELLSVLWFEQSSEEFQICISSLDLFPKLQTWLSSRALSTSLLVANQLQSSMSKTIPNFVLKASPPKLGQKL